MITGISGKTLNWRAIEKYAFCYCVVIKIKEAVYIIERNEINFKEKENENKIVYVTCDHLHPVNS